jgi:RecA-family ATPase
MAIDIVSAFEQEPPELDFVWPGFLAGTVGALVAPGATGKSFWALEAAMAVACSVPGGDLLGIKPRHTGRVVYLAAEDPEPVLTRRLHAIGQHLSPAAREAIAEQLFVEPTMGSRTDIMRDAHLRRVIEYCEGARLVVIDTLSRFHGLDENSNSDMSRLISVLEHIAAATGAAVLYLHHTSKAAALTGQGDTQQAARGASALIDNARWCAYIARMSEEESKKLSDIKSVRSPICDNRRRFFLKFGVSKQNYSELDMEKWFVQQKGGVLLPIDLVPAVQHSPQRSKKGDNDERW